MSSTRFRVLITDRAWPDVEIEREILGAVGAEVIDAPQSDEATLVDLARDADAIATCWARVTSAVIQSARRCRIVARLGIGLDNIDVETATQRGIPVTNVPDYCVADVSDHTLALMLACARKIALFDRNAKQGVYVLQAGGRLFRLQNCRLGLVGLGRIGQEVHRKARGIGMDVVAHTRTGKDAGTGCRMLPLDDLLRESDFVSLHLPLTESTRHLIGESALRLLKPTAFLINTSRGGLVDHRALAEALRQNRIGGAALDVFDPEPPDLSQPLFGDDRVIVTPHAAFLSQESLAELRTRCAGQVADALRGLRPPHVVNSTVYA